MPHDPPPSIIVGSNVYAPDWKLNQDKRRLFEIDALLLRLEDDPCHYGREMSRLNMLTPEIQARLDLLITQRAASAAAVRQAMRCSAVKAQQEAQPAEPPAPPADLSCAWMMLRLTEVERKFKLLQERVYAREGE